MQRMLTFGLTMMIELIAKRMRAEDGATLAPNPFQSRGENMRSRGFIFQEFFFSSRTDHKIRRSESVILM
jgi:hypothetical protein